MQGVDLVDDFLGGDAQVLGQRLDLVGHVHMGHELMQRRIQVTHGHGTAFQRLVHGLEVALLHRQDLGQRLLALLLGVGEDHLAHGRDAVGLEEHMLGAAQADALGAEGHRLLGVARGVGVGAHLEGAGRVGPAHEAGEVAGDGGLDGRDLAVIDVAGGAVQGDEVALVIDLAGHGQGLGFLVDLQLAAADDRSAAHAAGHDRRVGGHAAKDGQDALREVHALDVLRGGLAANEDNLFLVLAVLGRLVGGEVDAAGGGAGGGGQALGDDGRGLEGGGVKVGVQQAVKLLGLDLQNGLFLAQHAFVHQVHGDLEGRGRGALAVTGLEHVELAALDGVLHVLHVAVVGFQLAGDVDELLVHVGHLLLQVADGLGGTDAGHDVLALRIEQVFAVELLFTGGGVAGEGNAGAGGLAHVAKDHGLHVDGGAPVAGDVVHAAVVDGAGVVPAAEHGLHSFHQLRGGVLRELRAHVLVIDFLEARNDLLEVLGGQVAVELDVLLLLELVQNRLKLALGDLHNHVGEHGDETAVGVVGEVLVAGQPGQARHGAVVEAEVEDGVHHAGHGGAGAGTDGNKEGILLVAELLAGDLFGLGHGRKDLVHDVLSDHLAVGVIAGAGLGGHGEALGNGHAKVGHLGQVGALAAEQFAHVGVTLFEKVYILCHRVFFSSSFSW